MTLQLINYTIYRKGRKSMDNRPIDYCPKCGRKGERRQYADGSIMFAHKLRVTRAGVFVLPEVIDHCMIPEGGLE